MPSGGTVAAAAASARAKYSPEPMVDWWGVRTTATIRSTPSADRSVTACSMVGSTYLVPRRTTNRPGAAASSAAARPSTWDRVRAVRGEVPPIAS